MNERRDFVRLLGAAALFILLHQLEDLAVLVPATDFATAAGRVRQLVAIEARSPALLTADFLLIWAAFRGNSRRLLGTLGFQHLALGPTLLVLLPVLLLDAGELSSGLAGTEWRAFRVVVARTLVVLAVSGIASFLAGRVLWRAARVSRAVPANG